MNWPANTVPRDVTFSATTVDNTNNPAVISCKLYTSGASDITVRRKDLLPSHLVWNSNTFQTTGAVSLTYFIYMHACLDNKCGRCECRDFLLRYLAPPQGEMNKAITPWTRRTIQIYPRKVFSYCKQKCTVTLRGCGCCPLHKMNKMLPAWGCLKWVWK